MYSGRRGIKTDSQAERVKERKRERDRYPTENNVWMYEGRKK